MRPIITALFLSATLWAVPAQKLSLQDALVKLDQNNLELTVAKHELDLKKAALDEARSHHYGSLTLTENISRSNDAGNVFGFKLASRHATFGDFGFADFSMTNPNILSVQPADLNYPGYENFYQTKLTYMLPLYTGGKISAGSDIAKAMQALAQLDGEALKAQKRYEVKKSFYDLALLESFIKNLKKIQSNIRLLEKTTKTMIVEGYAKKVDLLEVQSKLASVDRLLTQSQANHDLALQFLSFLLNEEVLSIDESSISMPNYEHMEIDPKKLIMVQKAKQGVEISKEMVTIARADYLPTVGAMAEMASANNNFGGDFDLHKSYTVGVQIQWNLFSGMGTMAKYEQARLGALKAEASYVLAQKGLALQIKKLKTEINSLGAELRSIDAELKLQEQIVENYQDRYAEKLMSINNVMIAQSTHLQKTLEFKQTQNKQYDKILELDMLTQGATK